MKCPHGTPEGDICMGCGGLAQACPGCSRAGGRCWRHISTTVVVPPYTFRPFEPVDSTVYPFAVTAEGAAVAVPTNVVPELSWAPPPPVMFDRSQPGGPMLLLDSMRWPG